MEPPTSTFFQWTKKKMVLENIEKCLEQWNKNAKRLI